MAGVSKYLIYGLLEPNGNKLRYIGLSSNGLSRARSHLTKTTLARNNNPHKCNWIRKLQRNGLNPRIIVLEEFVNREELNEAEKFYIFYYRLLGHNLLNVFEGGEGAPHTEESKGKIQAATKRQWSDPQSLAKMKEANARPDSRKKKSESAIKRNAHLGLVLCFETGRTYRSVRELCEDMDLKIVSVNSVLNGYNKSLKGYTFKRIRPA